MARRRYFVGLIVLLVIGHNLSAQHGHQDSSAETLYAEAKAAESQGNAKGAIAAYEQVIRLNPHVAPAYNNLGSLYFDAGQYNKAIDVLKRGLLINPRMGTSYAILGSVYFAQGDCPKATKAFQLAVKENPEDKRSENLLEECLVSLQDFTQAVDRLRKRVASAPNDQDAWYRLGEIYVQLSQQALSKAKEINPTSPLAYELDGEVQEGLGRLAKAQSYYEQAVKAGPDTPGTHEHLGNILWLQALWSPAQAEFQAELVNNPHSCRTRWKLANCLLNQNVSTEQALSDLNTTVQECPDLMVARVDRAKALIALGRPADALQDLLLTVKADPNESSIHFLLAKVYRAQGRTVDASAEMQMFRSLVDQSKQVPAKSTTEN